MPYRPPDIPGCSWGRFKEHWWILSLGAVPYDGDKHPHYVGYLHDTREWVEEFPSTAIFYWSISMPPNIPDTTPLRNVTAELLTSQLVAARLQGII